MKTQFAWHVHHDKLIEPLIGSIEERIAYIKEYKPEHERDLRLRLLKPVIGPLPTIYDEAWKACVEAWKACDEAWKAYDEAKKVYEEAKKVYVEAWKAYSEAKKVYVEAEKASQPLIEQLHLNECPNCPWDGKTIFPPTSQGMPST